MKVLAILQARMGSVRFPNKVMHSVQGIPMIELLLLRLSMACTIDKIVLATSSDPRNQPLVDHVHSLGYETYRGSETDVLDRFYQAAKEQQPESIVRITGDCPLVDAELVDAVVRAYQEHAVDYATNTMPPTFPDGLDCEVFSFQALEIAAKSATRPAHREHVTPFLRESDQFTKFNLAGKIDYSDKRWTVDEKEDLKVVAAIFDHFSPRLDFGWREVMKLNDENPSVFAANSRLARNQGADMGIGQKLWKRAKKVIPGGNMLLSKRSEMFLPDLWPSYFSKAKGCKVWDLDGREYIDMSIMGVGTNVLGYGHPEVDEAVIETVHAGNMATLNCPEEVYLAERLIELHPWADMVRFARSGGEANAIAIRIARASAGRDNVAICGYHGWHDWYLSANLADDANLDGHLLPGLEPRGVPRNLKGTVFPFAYNSFDELETLVSLHNIGVIKMEVSRNFGPEDGFLEKVRELATKKNIVLIFDECTSGFRETFGGLHKKYGVEPDIAIFGKALGNGYAITAVIGRRAVMEAAQGTFISSTFWTERIGPTAALKTLEVMERERSWEVVTAIGLSIRKRWQALAESCGLTISHWGLPALTGFSFQSLNALKYKTLITQEMLAQGFLASNSVYASLAHTTEIVERYFEKLLPIFHLIQECENGRNVDDLLKGQICHSTFARLN